MKSTVLTNSMIGRILTNTIANIIGRNSRTRGAQYLTMRDRYNRSRYTGTAYRRRRNNNVNKIEINRAEGGYKQVYNNGRPVTQNIELYTSIYANTLNEYIFSGNTYSGDPKQYNLQEALNDNEEFLNLRRRALQYKIKYIGLSFNYNRVPEAKDKFSKMIITPITDTVMESTNPKINSISMVWDMSQQGTKNYCFRINSRNVDKSNQEWQEGIAFWSALMSFKISSQGINDVITNTDGVCLGELKITVSVLYVKLDQEQFEQGKLNDKTVLSMMANDNREKYQRIRNQMKIQENNRLVEKIKEANKKMEDPNSVKKFLNKSF